MKFLNGVWDVIYQFYNIKNGKFKFWFHIVLTIVLIVFVIGIRSQTSQRQANLKTIKNDTNQSAIADNGQFSTKNREKRITQAQTDLTQARNKYGYKSKEYQQAMDKYSRLQNAEFQVVSPESPGSDQLKLIQKVINEYGKVSDSQLKKDFAQNVALSTGELQWVYENKLTSMLGIENGRVALDVHDATLYVGFQFNETQGQTRFEKIAQLLYENSDLAPRTSKLTITYVS